MTEDEAGLKRCCGPEGCGEFNDKPTPERWCIGSQCMAWRTDNEIDRAAGEKPEGEGWEPGIPMYPSSLKTWNRVRAGGYCGLAGKP